MTINFLPLVGSLVGSSLLGQLGGKLSSQLAQELIRDKQTTEKIFKQNYAFSKNHYHQHLRDYIPELQPQASSRIIPIIYGICKVEGNIIWSSKANLKEFYLAPKIAYEARSISLAVAICEGKINQILRIWANEQLVDLGNVNLRIYMGDEEQLPDRLIENDQGQGKTPAFRGLAYVVFENLNLFEFGNQIPKFSFEVKRILKPYFPESELPINERIRSVIIIPGSGEFVYDPEIIYKSPKEINPKYRDNSFDFSKFKINLNNNSNVADAVLSIKQLKEDCPNVTWVAPVVGWFVSSLTAGVGKILPGVEFKNGLTKPHEWRVANFTRKNAYLIKQDQNENPIYGGTSNDQSLIRYLQFLKTQNYKILFYPMVFVDLVHKPWRGRITGSPDEIRKFFYQDNGYHEFILHYANLVKDLVDGFVIGSEMIGLTRVKDQNNNFPAVDALVDLAIKVKSIVGDKVKVTYAADWSEYHHTEGGWRNLDKLWACNGIDMVGIDAYFPLTNKTIPDVSEEEIFKGWNSGEGFDYYYQDQAKTIKKNLQPEYAWKNLKFWWENYHYNPDGSRTNWKPKQKKIWFTEIGFPSVELASNQPNVFYSHDSSESAFPIHSSGRVDFFTQSLALSATEKFWRNSEFLEQMFVWAWDARPFPFWPDYHDVWTDGVCWPRGHWLNGKLGSASLEMIIQDICKKCEIDRERINAQELNDTIEGFAISEQDYAHDIINNLKLGYFFDSYEHNGCLKFTKNKNQKTHEISYEQLVQTNSLEKFYLKLNQKSDLKAIKKCLLHYIDNNNQYKTLIEHSSNDLVSVDQCRNIYLPLCMSANTAKKIAELSVIKFWQQQTSYNFAVSSSFAEIKPNDLIKFKIQDQVLFMKVENFYYQAGGILKIAAHSIGYENFIQNFHNFDPEYKKGKLMLRDPGVTQLMILYLPALPYENPPYGVYLGVVGEDRDWRGAKITCPNGEQIFFTEQMIYGNLINHQDSEISEEQMIVEFDRSDILSQELSKLNNHKNLALLGSEVIEFKQIEFLGKNCFLIKQILREQYNSKRDLANKKFILLDKRIVKFALPEQQIGLQQEFLIQSHGHNEGQITKEQFVYQP